jgi:hypothetical protein
MSGVIQLTEETLYDYVTNILSVEDAREIHNGSDILNSLSPDAEEDLKERVWDLVKQELNYRNIVDLVQEWLQNHPENIIETDEEQAEDNNSINESEDEE